MPRILVIDDQEMVRSVVRAMLQSAGHQVREAANGAEGLACCRGEPVDLVVCDVFMPEVGGLEVVGLLRQELPGVPVVVMTGGSFGGTVDPLALAEKLGAATLRKPFTLEGLLAAVEDALGAGK